MKFPKCTFLLAGVTVISGMFVQPASAQQQLVVGFDGSYPPYASINKAGQLQGFEVDLASAVCTELKARCEFRNIPYDGIFAALEADKIDIVAAGLNITEERQKKYLMTISYLKGPLAIMVTKASRLDGTPASLNGKTVGTVSGSVFEKYLRQKIGPSVNVQTYDSMDAAVLDLDAGRVDAVLGEQSQLQPAYILAKPGVYKIAGAPVEDPTYAGRGKAMLLRKNETELLNRMNQATAQIIASGKQAELSRKWFGTVLPAK